MPKSFSEIDDATFTDAVHGTLDSVPLQLQDYMALSHAIAKRKGFWDEARNKAEMIALMHSELSEMLEAVRKPGPDAHCPEFAGEAIELADLLIRAFDYAAGHGIPLEAALKAKLRFNLTRPYKHGKKF